TDWRGSNRSWANGSGATAADAALAQASAQVGLEGEDLGGHGLRPQRVEARVPGIALGVPLVGEPAVDDVGYEGAHGVDDVEVVVTAGARELTVLTRRRVVRHLGGATLEAHEPVRPLDLAGEDELGDDRLEGHTVLEQD